MTTLRPKQMPVNEEREIWTAGRRQCNALITAIVYDHGIIATTDSEYITECQTKKALNREFPRHTFYFDDTFGDDYVHYFAARWTDDGLTQ